jgi:hypothetical protein
MNKKNPNELTDMEIVQALKSTDCQCGREKKSRMSHCSRCYFRLAPEMRQQLYKKLGQGYEEAYRESLEILNQK